MPKQLTLMFIQIGYQVNPEIIKNYVVWALNCATLMQAPNSLQIELISPNDCSLTYITMMPLR